MLAKRPSEGLRGIPLPHRVALRAAAMAPSAPQVRGAGLICCRMLRPPTCLVKQACGAVRAVAEALLVRSVLTWVEVRAVVDSGQAAAGRYAGRYESSVRVYKLP
jgi:hypothetical protein